MIKGISAIGPQARGTGDYTLRIMKVDYVDGVDIGASQAVS